MHICVCISVKDSYKKVVVVTVRCSEKCAAKVKVHRNVVFACHGEIN